MRPFEYIRGRYKVPAEKYREVVINGKLGVITECMGHYIGVQFYDNRTHTPAACHPTWEVIYLETFNRNPPILKMTASKRRYANYLQSESNLTFREWLGIKSK